MKKLFVKFFIIIMIFNIYILTLKGEMYFNLSLKEGGFYSTPNIYFINNVSSDIAYMYKFNNEYSILGYYQLSYSGPDIGNSIEAKFSERDQDHYIMLKSIIKKWKHLTLKPSVTFFKSFYKYSKNEEWGTGLYDLNKYEFGIESFYNGLSFLPFKFSYRFGIYNYPNYNDLLTMYVSTFNETKNIEDYKSHYFILEVNRLKIKNNIFINFSDSLTLSFYDNKKVIDANTGLEKNEYQRVFNNVVTFIPEYLFQQFYLSMEINVELNHCNQNFLSGYSPDPKDITILKNYYSYFYYDINPSFSYIISKDKVLSFILSLKSKHYLDRPAQDIEGNYISSKLYLNTYSFNIMYQVKLSKYFSLSPSYMYVKSISNNKYDRSIRYNYDSHLITLQLNYTY